MILGECKDDINYYKYAYSDKFKQLYKLDNGSKLFWENLLFNIRYTVQDTKENNIILVTHDHLIRNLLFPTRSQINKTKTLGDCACVKISIQNKQIYDISLFSKGYLAVPNQEIIQSTIELKNIQSFKGLYDAYNEIKQCNLYVVCHGNSMHNKPLNMSSLLYRPIDSSLTPLVIYQARLLGLKLKSFLEKTSVYLFCSELSRSKQTALTIKHFISPLCNNLNQIRLHFMKISINRILRRYKWHIFSKQNSLDMNKYDTIIDVFANSLDKSINVEDFRKYCNVMKGHYFRNPEI